MLPSREQCFALLEKYSLPENIQGHSLAVEKVAVFLAERLAGSGQAVDVELVSRAALLHDIDKHLTLPPSKQHGILSSQILERDGFPEIACIVRKHLLEQVLKEKPFSCWEEKLVFYADKRVNDGVIVSLAERYDYLLGRYGGIPEKAQVISASRPLVEKLEEEIFSLIKADSSLEELK